MEKKYDSIDLLKFILSLLVVMLHQHPLGDQNQYKLYPLVRIGVPIFFIISSWLFWKKIETASDPNDVLKGFVKRNIQLYVFWGIALLPITLYTRRYFQKGIVTGMLRFIKGLIFGSTFVTSWYIMALFIGMMTCYLLRNHNFVLGIIGILTYVFSCMTSNYLFILKEIPKLYNAVEKSSIYFPNSFVAGIVWIVIGKIIAENKLETKSKISWLIISDIILYILLAIENDYLQRANLFTNSNDVYFFLIPVCTSIFLTFLKLNVHIKCSRKLRAASTVMYCLHPSINPIVFRLMKILFNVNELVLPYSLLGYIVLVTICLMATALLYHYRNRFAIFKYSF